MWPTFEMWFRQSDYGKEYQEALRRKLLKDREQSAIDITAARKARDEVLPGLQAKLRTADGEVTAAIAALKKAGDNRTEILRQIQNCTAAHDRVVHAESQRLRKLGATAPAEIYTTIDQLESELESARARGVDILRGEMVNEFDNLVNAATSNETAFRAHVASLQSAIQECYRLTEPKSIFSAEELASRLAGIRSSVVPLKSDAWDSPVIAKKILKRREQLVGRA